MSRANRLLSISVATDKFGYVYLIDGMPYDWGLSVTASHSTAEAYAKTLALIEYYRPRVVLTERVTSKSRKGKFTRKLTDAISRAAQDGDVVWAQAARRQAYPNKYEEAQALVDQFPDLVEWLPPVRKIYEKEPRKIIIFEALSLALRLSDNSGQG